MESYLLQLEKTSLDDMDRIILFIEDSTKKLEVAPAVTEDIVLATMEAITNILTHGYKENPGFVEIEVKKNEKSLIVVFRDLAELFDPTLVSSPDIHAPLDQHPAGGLGVYLIKSCVDEIIHQMPPQGGNELICIKKNIF